MSASQTSAGPAAAPPPPLHELPSLQPKVRVPQGRRWKLVRRALWRYAAGGRPGPFDDAASRRMTILLVSAWGMGGTIRAALNLAGYLAARGWEVEILSNYRRVDESFFGSLPEGVKVTALDDQRPGHEPGPLARWMRRRPSVLVHPSDRLAHTFTLLTDWRLARALRGGTGFLMSTRPALNLMAVQLAPPGFVRVGLEQMHFHNHGERLHRAMKAHYPKLDSLVVLTEQDVRSYDRHLKGRLRLDRIPNTVREMPGPKADLGARRVLAAGRLRAQKGFECLIQAWAQVHAAHPDWQLRICGEGRLRGRLQDMIDGHGLTESVELAGPGDMPVEMAEASIFAMPSRFEGFPLILLEAMSKGMGVVSFDCPTGPADIIDNRRNGIIVAHKDVDALAAGLIGMIGDEALRRRCGPAAIETAREFSMESVGPRWETLLSQLSAARRAR